MIPDQIGQGFQQIREEIEKNNLKFKVIYI